MNWVRKKNTGARSRPVRPHGRRLLSSLAAAALLSSSLVAVGLTAPIAAQAAPGDPFDPAGPVVFIAQGDPSQLQRAETTGTGVFAFSDEGAPASSTYNAIAFNPADNYIYGMSLDGSIPQGALVRIGQGGTVTRVGTTIYSTAAGEKFFIGAFNPADGLFYVGHSNAARTLLGIDVTTGAIVRTVQLDLVPGVQDITFKDGFGWGVASDGGLRRFDLATGTRTDFPGILPNAANGYGGAWNFGNGNLGFSDNATGRVTQLQIVNAASANPTFKIVSAVAGPSSTLNDGTSIPGLPSDLAIVKSGPPTYVRGSRIGFPITVTNNGPSVSSGWTVTDTLPTGLSNPSVSGNVTIAQDPDDSRILTFNGGRLDPGESTTFTVFADTTSTPNTCLANTASVLGNELDPVSSNNESTATPCDLGLTVQKTSDATADTRPGDVVTYTVTATNTGAGAFTAANPARIYDDLSGVLDDAAYNADASASRPGTIDYTAPRLSWSGALAAGASVSLTYTVTMGSSGDGVARNVAWIPDDPGITTPPSCDPALGGVDTATGQPCAVTSFEMPRLTVDKSADRSDLPAVGDTVTYTIVVANTGPGDYTATAPATATDDLSAVLDDATFVAGSLSSSSGTATRAGDTITWSGALAAGQQATITYAVTYTGGGDQVLRNTACVPTAESLPGAVPCDTVRIPGALLNQWKTATPSSDPVVAGSTITYTLFFDNDGQTAATVDAVDDLRYVTDDADVTIEPTASSGLTAVRTGDRISITGSVPVGATSTVTYTVTVRPDGQRGDNVATNFLLPPGEEPPPGGVCVPADGQSPDCTVTPVTAVTYTKTVSASETPVRAGTELTYTITVANTGGAAVDVLRDDDLTEVLDDADLTGDPASDTASVTVAGPASGILSLRGTLAAGRTATVTYTVTVKDDEDRGNDLAVNFLLPPGTPPGTCDPGTCTTTPIQGYTVAKAADAADVAPGGVVTYTVTLVNTGQVAFTAGSPATFTDDLSGVLDDATYNGDASAGGSIAGNTLTWSGPLAVGETKTVTYSVTVGTPPAGDQVLRNAVVPNSPGGVCDPDAECGTETPVASFTIAKTADAASAMAGDTVTYTVTVTNTGKAAFTAADPAAFTDELSGVLDDATYNGDVSAGGTVAGTTLSWSGPLAVGETKTVTYSVTVNDPLTGDGDLANTVTTTVPGGSCEDARDCETHTPVGSFTVTKQADVASARPGEVVTYTVTVVNTGDVAYTAADPASFTDDLSGVLDDAVYNDDVSAGGTVAGSTLTWTSALAVGETKTVSYSVTVDDPITGDFLLKNAVVPTGPGGSCDGACTTSTPLGSFRVVKTAGSATVVPGDVVTYSVAITNTGQVAYTAAEPASFTDDLSAVLDDATYNADASSTSGAGTAYAAPVLSWSGPLAVGATVTITYSVTVNDPATGDRRMSNTVVTPPGSGGNCIAGSDDPDCIANVPAASFSIAKTADRESVKPGDVVTYTVTVTNTGAIAYTATDPASFTDDLSRVLDDAVYNDDVSTGGTVTGTTLTWEGALAVEETIRVTYSVTVDDPVSGDFALRNVVAPSSPGGECAPGECVTDTPVASYTVQKDADVQDVVLGGIVTYTVTVTNIGQVDYTADSPASFEDDLSGVLDDAAYNEDATNGAVVDGDRMTWEGAVGVGESLTITYSVTVNLPATGDQQLRNAVSADGPGGRCTDDGDCVTETPVATYRVQKQASTATAAIGDRIVYTVIVTNTGQVPYTDDRPASFTDDLGSALNAATYNGDATGGAVYEAPVLSWEGALEVGESATVTYSVTVRESGEIRNVVVTPDGSGANCPAVSVDPDCATTTVVPPPGLATTGGALWTLGAVGGAGLLATGLVLIHRRRNGNVHSA